MSIFIFKKETLYVATNPPLSRIALSLELCLVSVLHMMHEETELI